MKLRLAIDADDEARARAIAGEVFQAMDVAVGAEPQATRSTSRTPYWNVIADLDLSAAGAVTPNDARTRFYYVIRNLPGITFVSPRRGPGDEHTGMWQWLPDSWDMANEHQELVHSAVRAAGIYIQHQTEPQTGP